MDIQEVIDKLKEALDLAENLQESQLNEMAPYITKLGFPQFKTEVLKRYQYKKQKQKMKNKNPELAAKSFPDLPYENKCWGFLNKNNIIITNNCIEHVEKKHFNMTTELWEEFLNTCNPNRDIKVKAKYNGSSGNRWIYKCSNGQHYFGYVLDIFPKANPQVVTVFCDKEANVDNWIQNTIPQKQDYYNV